MALSYTVAAVTPAYANNYITARGLSGWPTNTDDQTAALRRGQDHIARIYNGRWSVEFTDDDAPEVVKFAIIEAALVEARNPGSLAPTVKATDAKILTGAGSISWTPVSVAGGVEALMPRLLHVEAMLTGAGLVAEPPIFLARA
jgi:hypothetical protein